MNSINRLAASAQVNKFEGARFKGFYALEDAIKAWDHAPASPARFGPLPVHSGPRLQVALHLHPVDLHPQASARKFSNEDCYWLVTSGDRPGVYRGLTAARAAVGTYRAPALCKNTQGEGPAAILFVEKYTSGQVHGGAH
ncbi:hypothetical protein D9615_010628 [Tricholomella constricta]|uniref:Uncharacterized protein n=1 Tax=Tricholomella constricta TaxID=117010 RepID=A0A8H5LRB8_9AGAR|nr:hypothetical protein D9615_010628 [Tricholomella constricta]